MSLDDPSDTELVRLFRDGDDAAFDVLVRRHQDRIYRLAIVWLHDPQLADDATQEVFLRAWRGLRGFRFRAAPFTWLYRTARLVCREFDRRRPAEPLEDEPVDESEVQDHALNERRTAQRVRELVADLPDRQRQVVLLRIFEDLSVAEAARAMGCREGTVKALLHKAVKNMKAPVESEGIGL